MKLQQGKCLFRVPAGMPELYRRSDPTGEPLKKGSEAFMVGGKIRGKLDKEDSEFFRKETEAMTDPADPFLRFGKPLVMR